MKHNQLLERFTELLAQHSREIEIAVAAQRLDTARLSEQIVLGLLREVCGFKHLKNLNATEARSFPGLDLIDEVNRIGVQVTATPTLEKIKETIETCKRHGLDSKIDRLIVYVLTQRQASYAQASIDGIGALFRFDASRDVVDFRGLARVAETIEPNRLSAAVTLLESYLRGVPAGLADADFDPPASPASKVSLNLLEVYFPSRLFVANLLDAKAKGGKRGDERNRVRAAAKELGRFVPSDYMARAGQLITFHDLEGNDHPFMGLIDPGTVTPLSSREFYSIDVDHESTFKGLLRFTLQQKLHRQRVTWKHDDGLFVFLPDKPEDEKRRIVWSNKKKSTRTVFERKRNNKDPSKTLICKHLAFAVDFVRNDAAWYIALTPDWFFSYGDHFDRSRFSDKPLAWLKRRETNQIVMGHFRFLCVWLKSLDGEDLFNNSTNGLPSLTFTDDVSFPNHPPLDDEQWLPVRTADTDTEGDMFGHFGDEA